MSRSTRRLMLIPDPEAFNETLAKLREKAHTAILLVEGEKDKRALRSWGISGEVFLLNKYKRSLRECAEQISKKSKNVILLFDNDTKGRELARKMKIHLRSLGVNVDEKIGIRLLSLAKSTTVEGLAHLA